jgi:hypothetical protein
LLIVLLLAAALLLLLARLLPAFLVLLIALIRHLITPCLARGIMLRLSQTFRPARNTHGGKKELMTLFFGLFSMRAVQAAPANGWAVGSAVKAISPLDTIYYYRRRYRRRRYRRYRY